MSVGAAQARPMGTDAVGAPRAIAPTNQASAIPVPTNKPEVAPLVARPVDPFVRAIASIAAKDAIAPPAKPAPSIHANAGASAPLAASDASETAAPNVDHASNPSRCAARIANAIDPSASPHTPSVAAGLARTAEIAIDPTTSNPGSKPRRDNRSLNRRKAHASYR